VAAAGPRAAQTLQTVLEHEPGNATARILLEQLRR